MSILHSLTSDPRTARYKSRKLKTSGAVLVGFLLTEEQRAGHTIPGLNRALISKGGTACGPLSAHAPGSCASKILGTQPMQIPTHCPSREKPNRRAVTQNKFFEVKVLSTDRSEVEERDEVVVLCKKRIFIQNAFLWIVCFFF